MTGSRVGTSVVKLSSVYVHAYISHINENLKRLFRQSLLIRSDLVAYDRAVHRRRPHKIFTLPPSSALAQPPWPCGHTINVRTGHPLPVTAGILYDGHLYHRRRGGEGTAPAWNKFGQIWKYLGTCEIIRALNLGKELFSETTLILWEKRENF